VEGDEAPAGGGVPGALAAGGGVGVGGGGAGMNGTPRKGGAGGRGGGEDGDGGDKYKKRAPLYLQLVQRFAPEWTGAIPKSMLQRWGAVQVEFSLPIALKAPGFFNPLATEMRYPGFKVCCFRIRRVPLHSGAIAWTRWRAEEEGVRGALATREERRVGCSCWRSGSESREQIRGLSSSRFPCCRVSPPWCCCTPGWRPWTWKPRSSPRKQFVGCVRR
jgi:hypothetical protein